MTPDDPTPRLMESQEDFDAKFDRLRAEMDAIAARLFYAPPDSHEQQALMQRHTQLYNQWQGLVADRMERVADTASEGHPMADVLRDVAAQARAARVPVPVVKMPPPLRTPLGGARSRERRERRHVARATSSADPGDPAPPLPPAHGLAVCPLCTDETAIRPLCPLCWGLGYIAREHRNRWKRGERP